MLNMVDTETFSEKEKLLFSSLACQDLLKQEPYLAYRTAAEFCFLSDMRGPSVDSLRRCMNTMISSKAPHRLTEEFDNLIELGLWSAVGHEFFVIAVKREGRQYVDLHKAVDKIYLIEEDAVADLASYGDNYAVKRLVAYLD
jgi:hypothetical protein